MKPAIHAENLAKEYRIGSLLTGGYKTLRETIMNLATSPYRKVKRLFSKPQMEENDSPRTHWALRGVDFDVNPGEVVGLIGRNGAGKSTLLKLISRITEPTHGRLEVRGRVVSLLEVGTGFHQELTGRENIYLNGAILGMTRREIARKFDDIVQFAEVGKYLDTPTKHYSSGMYTRLAFAVAANLEAEVLLVDEVLAVGDAAFQKKCMNRMKELGKSGSTVMFVSHSMGTVAAMCETAMVLDNGELIGRGEAHEQIRLYVSRLNERLATNIEEREDRSGTGKAKVTDIRFLDADGKPVEYAMGGHALTIRVFYKANEPLSNTEIHLTLTTEQGLNLTHLSSRFTGDVLNPLPLEGSLDCVIPEVALAKGRYLINVELWDALDEVDNIVAASRLDVEPGTFFTSGRTPGTEKGLVLTRHNWKPTDGSAS